MAMASLPPPTITPPALRSWPSFPNISRASIIRKHNNNGGRHQSPLETPASGKFGRRNVLLLIGGLYSTTTTGLNAAKAAPASTAVPKVVFPVTLDKVLRVLVQRPRKSRSKSEKDEEEEILVIDGIEFDNEEYVKFDVLINDEDEKGSAPSKTEFAGSFARLPHKNKREGMKTRTCLRLGISELLEDLGAEDDDALVVTLVPRSGSRDLTVAGVKIEFA